MSTYLPIPVAVDERITDTIHAPKTDCHPAGSVTQTVSFIKPKSTIPLEKRSDFQTFVEERDNSGSFSDVKKRGIVKMTPLRITNEKHTYHVKAMERPYFEYKILRAGRPLSKDSNGQCRLLGPVFYDTRPVIVSGRYIEQGDLSYWKSKYPNLPHLKRVEYLDKSDVEAAKADAYSELFTGYGLGEELAELKESMQMLYSLTNRAFKLLTQFKSTIGTFNLVGSDIRLLSESWMEFRYGIMPIAYSISDIMTLLNEKGRFRTIRKKVKPRVDEDMPPSGCYFEDAGTSSISCKVTAKGCWASQELKMLDLIDINILTTGIQCMRWTMVVNWFINIYSFVGARVKSLTTLSSDHNACVAIRTRMEYGTYLYFVEGYSHHLYDEGDSGNIKGYYGYHDFGVHSDIVRSRLLLSWVSVNNYHRYLYQPSDVKLVYHPFIDWRRGIDGLIMGWGQLSKALRRLL